MENLYVNETIYFREKHREDCASRYQFVVALLCVKGGAVLLEYDEKRPHYIKKMLSSPDSKIRSTNENTKK